MIRQMTWRTKVNEGTLLVTNQHGETATLVPVHKDSDMWRIAFSPVNAVEIRSKTMAEWLKRFATAPALNPEAK